MIYPQYLLDIHDELIVDLFAGGGGASCGIEMATGRQVDIAVNHDAIAVALHKANHPQTHHERADVFEVDPRTVTGGRPVGLLWASPDCTYYSKARGGKPIRSKQRKRRALAWVVKRWAAQVRPRVIMLENVEEFRGWGPLIGLADRLRPCPRRRGRTYRRWKRDIEDLGYVVEEREMRAHDYGAPTIRKRLFVIARCDGRPIVWPTPTHGPGTRHKHRAVAECIDWSVPMLSIFASREEARAWAKANGTGVPQRPLKEPTLRRVARGVIRYVVQSAKPFIVQLTHHGWFRGQSIDEPLHTVTAAHRGESAIATASLVHIGNGERDGQQPRVLDIDAPLNTIVASNKFGLVSAFLSKHFTGVTGSPLSDPKGTVTTIDHDSLVAASLATLRGTSTDADPAEPLHTISAGGTHHAITAAHLVTHTTGHAAGDLEEPLHTVTTGGQASLVYAFLDKYYGVEGSQGLRESLHTITTKDRFSLVAVKVHGMLYVIVDILLRMLTPRELFSAQGFPLSYIIQTQVWCEKRKRMRSLTKTEQVRLVGNSVPPQFAMALVRANCPELRARDEVAA